MYKYHDLSRSFLGFCYWIHQSQLQNLADSEACAPWRHCSPGSRCKTTRNHGFLQLQRVSTMDFCVLQPWSMAPSLQNNHRKASTMNFGQCLIILSNFCVTGSWVVNECKMHRQVMASGLHVYRMCENKWSTSQWCCNCYLANHFNPAGEKQQISHAPICRVRQGALKQPMFILIRCIYIYLYIYILYKYV